MKRILAVCVLALSGVAMTAPPCWACSCAGGVSKEEHGKGSDAVFYGKVVHIRYPGYPDDGPYGGGNLKVKIWVQTVYKGKKIARRTVVRTGATSSCGVSFEKGERYTVFASRHNGLKTNSCMATKEGNINPDNYGLREGSEPQG